ncbi:MAG: hypothetical protein MK105_15690 [Crocinitomicaceae bacterium]|nr:hypothetical protein [Crocinitomicaceae bacterium]
MNTKEFVIAFKELQMDLLEEYKDPASMSAVKLKINQLGLDHAQNEKLNQILDNVLTDALYTVLLGLDGAARIGSRQERYKIEDEFGELITTPDGQLEAVAFEVFQEE